MFSKDRDVNDEERAGRRSTWKGCCSACFLPISDMSAITAFGDHHHNSTLLEKISSDFEATAYEEREKYSFSFQNFYYFESFIFFSPKSKLINPKKMTRGNQRDLARAKNQKKQAEAAKKKQTNADGLTLEQRKHRDAEVMREKQRKKEGEPSSQAKYQGIT